jgi:putative transcriptional regulator
MIKVALEELLAKRGKSAYWLAKQAGLHQSVVSKLRHNEMIALRLDVLDRVCDALECEPGELLVRQAGRKREGKGKR